MPIDSPIFGKIFFMENTSGAAFVATQYLTTSWRTLAYRIIGEGQPIIWCNRFRGTIDDWDHGFINKLATWFKIILFDYSGIGLSTGELPTEIAKVAEDVKDLADGLQIDQFIIGGWSYGGIVAQTFATRFPHRISHTILIGTSPAGKNNHLPEPIFMETSSHIINDYEDHVILFFEPSSANSRKAATASLDRIAQRTNDKSIPVPEQVWGRYYEGVADYAADHFNTREKLGKLSTPVLVISGDHDLVCPVENWYALTRKMPNLYINVLPESGHGPQHQYPLLCAKYIISFIEYYHT